MDDKDLELYQEENLQTLKSLKESIDGLQKLFTDKIEIKSQILAPSKVTIENQVEDVEVSNLNEIKDALDDLGSTLSKAIESNAYKPLKSVEVSNLKDFPSSIDISNIQELKGYFTALEKAIKNNQPIVQVTKQEIRFPSSPKDYISVRLTDGKEFYKALFGAVSSAVPTVSTASGIAVPVANPDGTNISSGTGGSGTAAYSDSGGTDRKGLVDADRHVQVDVLTMPSVSIDTTGLSTATNQDTTNARIGATDEAAASTDTSTSGLNGLLKRIAQRLTSLIALFPTSLGQKTKANSFAVTLASDQDALPVTDNGGSLTVDDGGGSITVDGTVTANTGLTQPLTDAQLRATAVPVSGTFWQATQPVSGTVTANLGGTGSLVDNAAFTDGTTRVVMGGYIFDETAGTALTENDAAAARIDSKRAVVGVIEDATTRGRRAAVSAAGALSVSSVGNVAHDAVDSGEPVKIGGVARTSNPTAVANGDRVDSNFDKVGRQVVFNGVPRELLVTPTIVTISNTTETTALAAGGANVFHDVYAIIITNTSATATEVTFRDATGGTVRFKLSAPANDTRGISFPFVVPQTTANNNWTAQAADSVSSLDITVFAMKNI